MHETNGSSVMALQLQSLLENFGLIHQVIIFVKDEGNNLGIIATTLHSIIDCELLKLLQVYEGTCFGHVVFKVC
jgi:hypothetical protein